MEQIRKDILQAQIAEAMTSEEFCAAVLKCGDAESVCRLLAENGITATADEIAAFKADGDSNIQKLACSEGELSADELEDVSGGGKFWRGVAAIAGGAVLGFGLGVVSGVCPAFTPVAYKIGVGYGIVAGTWVARG